MMNTRLLNFEERDDVMVTVRTTIEELLDDDLISVRTYNVCLHQELRTVGDIVRYYDEYKFLLNLRNCGAKSASELMTIISNIKNAVEKFDDASECVQQVFIDEYELFTSNPENSSELVEAFKIIFPSPAELFEIGINRPEDVLGSDRYSMIVDGALAYKVRCIIVEMISEIDRRLSVQLKEEESVLVSFKKLSRYTKGILSTEYKSDYCRYELSPIKRELLINEFNELVNEASTKAKSICKAFIKDMYGLVPLLDMSEEQIALKFGNKKVGGMEFYHQVLVRFRVTYQMVLQGDIDDSFLSIAVRFPFLEKENIDFVLNFRNEKGHLPMFYIINEQLKKSQERDIEMFCQRYALGKYSEKIPLAEIADSNSVSKERARQITLKVQFDESVFKIGDWSSYASSEEIFLLNQSGYFRRIISEEQLNISFEGFAKIYTKVFQYTYKCKYGIEYMVSEKFAQKIDILISNVIELKNGRFSSYQEIPISKLCESKTVEPELCNVVKSVIAPLLEVEMVGDSFCFAQTYINHVTEVYNYLYSVGEPVHIDKIAQYINDKYPESYISVNSLKAKLRGSNEILPVGKTSNYRLSHWRNVYGGSIRDLVRDIMLSRDTPVHIDELTSLVTDVFETTNKKSIHASLHGCDDFVPFNDGYYGLSNKRYPPEFVEVDLSKIRASFETRFENYKQFVEDCGRLPYSSGIDEEDSLKRWQVNVIKRVLDVTDEQVEALTNFMKSKSNLPSSGFEERFYRTCKEYMEYVKKNFELPNNSKSSSLAAWFRKNISLYSEYEDNRKVYFTELLQELNGYGFVV